MTEDTFHLGIKALIRNAAGNVLVMKVNPEELHSDRRTYYDLPGGRIERGETIQQTLTREITEETGLTEFKIGRSLGMGLSNLRIPLKSGGDVGLVLGIFECTVAGEADIKLSFEHTEYDWVTPGQAAELLKIKFPPELCDAVGRLSV